MLKAILEYTAHKVLPANLFMQDPVQLPPMLELPERMEGKPPPLPPPPSRAPYSTLPLMLELLERMEGKHNIYMLNFHPHLPTNPFTTSPSAILVSEFASGH